jgi:toxin YxiD
VRARAPHVLRSALGLLLALTALVVAAPPAEASKRDLARDEKRGGHTLSRHVGRTDEELRERLRKEPGISAASTYTDRAAAEEAVTLAIRFARKRVDPWLAREGSRANLVIDWPGSGKVLGRSLRRGEKAPVPCKRALVVLKWDPEAEIYYVLTSYPEAEKK